MDTLRKIETLFARAGRAEAPVFHVSDRVIGDLAALRAPRLAPWSLFAGLSAAAAVVMLLLGVQAWQTLNSPLVQLLSPLQETSLW